MEKHDNSRSWTKKLGWLGWDESFSAGFYGMENEGDVPARVAREEKGLYLVIAAEGELLAGVSGAFMNRAAAPADYPKVGDWVAVSPRFAEGRGTIQRVLPRRNCISRKEPWLDTAEQIIAANVDRILVVTALDQDFNLRRLERYLAMAYECGAQPAIVLNKADLCPACEERMEEAIAAAPGCEIRLVSAVSGLGIPEMTGLLPAGKTAIFLDSSGVGKSSLINCLLGRDKQEVKTVRENDGKGRHTTIRRELIALPDGGLVIDCPGLREIQLWSDGDGLDSVFAEIGGIAGMCRFDDCKHESEPGCAVLAAMESGELDKARYASYLKLKKEVGRLERKKEDKERRAARAAARKSRRKKDDGSWKGWG